MPGDDLYVAIMLLSMSWFACDKADMWIPPIGTINCDKINVKVGLSIYKAAFVATVYINHTFMWCKKMHICFSSHLN